MYWNKISPRISYIFPVIMTKPLYQGYGTYRAPYHCAIEPKSHRGVAAYCANTPIWMDKAPVPMVPIRPYTLCKLLCILSSIVIG